MDISFATHSRFLAACEEAIRQGKTYLDSGCVVQVELEEGGYNGRIFITIRPGNSTYFETDWEGNDETRFPARIKAAATALMRCGHVGRFVVAHKDGMLEISGA